MNFVNKIIRWLYEPPQRKILAVKGSYDLVVPLDYGTIDTYGKLPGSTKRCTVKATQMLSRGIARDIAWSSCTTFGSDPNTMYKKKLEIVRSYMPLLDGVTQTISTNSIDEAESILRSFTNAKSILLVADWRHARRSVRIWKGLFSGTVHVLTIDSDWNENHPSVWCKSNLRFLTLNLLYHVIMMVMGVNFLRGKVHHIRK